MSGGRCLTIFNIFLAIAIVLSTISISFASDTKQTWEDRYKDEPYIYLLTEKIVELRKDFTTSTTMRTVARIQKEGGKSLGEVKLEYDKSREVISQMEAYTTTPDGVRLKASRIQELNPHKDYAIYSDQRLKVITMPNVTVGSTIEWQVTAETTKPVIDKHFYERFYLSSEYPVKVIRCKLIIPEDIDIHIKYFNDEKKPEILNKNNKVIYTWEVVDTHKVQYEEYMPPWDELLDSVAVSTLNSWEDVSLWAWHLFKKNMRLSDDMKAKVDELTKDRKSTEEKVQAIIKYVWEDFRYVAMNMEFHNYEPHPSDQIFSNKYGDCKDHTVLGMAMLSEIGIDAYPVLYPSSMGFNGNEWLPMPSYFNHAILYFEINGKKYFTDLLRKGYHFTQIPHSMAGRNVFVINDDGGFFGTIPDEDKKDTVSIIEEEVVIDEDGDALIEMVMFFTRNASNSMRESIKNMTDDEKKKMFAAFESQYASGGTVLEMEWKNLDKPYEKIVARLKYKNSNWLQRIGDMMIFGMPKTNRSSMFSSPKRVHPIVFNSNSRYEKRVSYTIPDGYDIVNLPSKIYLNHDFATYERVYSVDRTKITGTETYVYRELRTPAEQYQKVKGFFDDIAKMTNSQIMIKKKS